MNQVKKHTYSVRETSNRIMRKVILYIVCLAVAFPALAGNMGLPKNIVIPWEKGALTLQPLNKNTIRVRYLLPDSKEMEELVYIEQVSIPPYKVKEDDNRFILSMENISVEFDKKEQTLTFKKRDGSIILKEIAGKRRISNSFVQGESTFIVEQGFVSSPDEYIYGTGQFQDGYLNIRGLTRRLTQVNTQIAIPFILSNKGYGLLWNNYGMTDFNPADNNVDLTPTESENQSVTVDVTSTTGNKREERRINGFTGIINIPESGEYSLLLDVGQKMARKHFLSIDGKNVVNGNNLWLPPTTSLIVRLEKGEHVIEVQGELNDKPSLYWRKVTDETVFRSPVAQALDYTVFAGNADEVISSYRQLTGEAPMMPLWALGYIHCRERFNTQDEILENAGEFRKRKLPIDVIVQDWQYWGKHGWNAMRFDEDRYPDPVAMIRKLHDMNIRFMISVWSKIDVNSVVGKQMTEKGFYIPETDWIDFFNPAAADFYWQNFSKGLLKPYQIDAWWQDATEPENDDLHNRRVNNGKSPGEVYRNIYPLFVNKTVYEGLRKDAPEKRAMILTRSGFSGIQRYATATWSGDVGNDWETLRRQISGGLGQMASGLPWWTYDAGGFFRPSDQHTNKEFHERLLRWLQASVFFPLMRVHGYMSQTEPWRYGEDVEKIASQYLNFRYSLLPYIYSHAADVTFSGSTLMRPLVMDFPNDNKALEQKHEFMFGQSLLVAPVTESAVGKWNVYLPTNSSGWIDFWSGNKNEGGQFIDVDVDITKIPLFVKSGSIIPLCFGKQYASEKTEQPMEIRVYPGEDASFVFYEDEGDNYNYEKGRYSTIEFKWNERSKTFNIGKRKGNFDGMEPVKIFNIVLVSLQEGLGMNASSIEKKISYNGKAQKLKF